MVSRSNTKSEYRGVANGAAKIAWTESFLHEFFITPTQSPLIFYDNISATYLAANPFFMPEPNIWKSTTTLSGERVLQRALSIQFTPSNDQLADCMTKPLST